MRPVAVLTSGRLFITVILAAGGGVDGFWIDATDDAAWARGTKRIIELNSQGWNIYFSPNSPRLDFEGSKPKLKDIPECRVLQVDIDPKDVASLEHALAYALVKEVAHDFAKRFPPSRPELGGRTCCSRN